MSTNITFLSELAGAEWFKYVYLIAFVVLSVAASAVLKNTNERISEFKPKISNAVVTVVLIAVSILSFSGVSTFLYFHF